MIRRLKPTRIELKKVDLEEFEQRVRDNSVNGNSSDAKDPLPTDEADRQTEVHKRIGFQPQPVQSDGGPSINL